MLALMVTVMRSPGATVPKYSSTRLVLSLSVPRVVVVLLGIEQQAVHQGIAQVNGCGGGGAPFITTAV